MTGSDEREYRIDGEVCELRIHELGELVVTSGRVTVGDVSEVGSPDPLSSTITFDIPNGSYPVHAVMAEFTRNGRQDSVHAFLSLVTGNAPTASVEAIRRPHAIALFEDVVNVEGGMVAFADAHAIADRTEDQFEEFYHQRIACLPPEFELQGERTLPWRVGRGGENLIFCMSGWGDGSYTAAETRDVAGQLTGVHVNFDVFDEVDRPAQDWASFTDLKEAVTVYLRDPALALAELGGVIELDAVLGFTLERQTRQQDWGEQLVQEIAVTDGRRVILWIGEDTVTDDDDADPGAPLLNSEIRVLPVSSLVDVTLEVNHSTGPSGRSVHSAELRLSTAVPDYSAVRNSGRNDFFCDELFFMKSPRNGGVAQAQRLVDFGRIIAEHL